ncbi:hypothetical protein DMC47_12960 [Nostoc sp. 3335mG]|nr:hypothetical protein DMC47_12960 [Nostoc sp. 3335mG]
MRTWAALLAGLAIWTAHFFLVYAIGEFGGEEAGHRAAVIVITLIAIAANLVLLRVAMRMSTPDPFDRWRRAIACGGLMMSALAVLWQGLPALFAG